MTKADLMVNFDRIVTDERLSLELVNHHLEKVTTGGYLLDDYTAVTSGGSTGERGVFVYDWDGWVAFWLSAFRYQLLAKWSDPELASRPAVIAWVAAAHFTHATAALSRTFASPRVRQRPLPRHARDREHGRRLERGPAPDFLVAYPSALHVLSVEARAGRLRIAPHRVLSCAEPLLPEIRAAAEEAWGAGVGNIWGMSEGGCAGVACEHARMHRAKTW